MTMHSQKSVLKERVTKQDSSHYHSRVEAVQGTIHRTMHCALGNSEGVKVRNTSESTTLNTNDATVSFF
eukprot:scaffold599_cov180-Amphora_coffeaeformis.AAC.6